MNDNFMSNEIIMNLICIYTLHRAYVQCFIGFTHNFVIIVITSIIFFADPVIAMPFFRSMMSRDRFLLIMSMLHLADNSKYIKRGQPGYDPLYKMGRIYKQITER